MIIDAPIETKPAVPATETVLAVESRFESMTMSLPAFSVPPARAVALVSIEFTATAAPVAINPPAIVPITVLISESSSAMTRMSSPALMRAPDDILAVVPGSTSASAFNLAKIELRVGFCASNLVFAEFEMLLIRFEPPVW